MNPVNFDWSAPLNFSERNGKKLAYRYQPGQKVTLVYLGGFHSNMNGEKSFAVFNHATKKYKFSALCLDYSGHGSSEGVFEEGNISTWLEDTLHLINSVTQGPLLICGSSMGGWLALLVALKLKNRVKAILTIATATDMTQKFIWDRCDETRRNLLQTQGYFDFQSQYDDVPYRITKQLVEDGKNHLLLGGDIPLNCPVRLLHGTADKEIAWQNSLETMEKLTSQNVQVKLIKGSGHRLSEPEYIEEILKEFDTLAKLII